MATCEELNALDMMLQYGGNFVKALANAHKYADPANRVRLRAAFPEIFKRYSEMYEMRRKACNERGLD
jgi:hypothetical protein